MSTTLVRDYIGAPLRRRVAGQVLAKRCAGMAGGPDEASAAEAVRKLADGESSSEAERAMWRWAWPGMRDHEIGVLVAWGGVGAEALAKAVCIGQESGYEATRERVIRGARTGGLHGVVLCRTEEELGPAARECVRRVEISRKKEDGCCWIDAGGSGGRIGVPWEVVEEVQRKAGEEKRSHTAVKRQHHTPVWLVQGFAEPEERTGPWGKYCRDMRYGLSMCSEPILLLGDAVVVEGRIGYAKPHDPLEETEREMESVYLPLGKDRLLAGWRKGHEPRELGWVLAAQARLARRSFIGADIANEYAEKEQGRIGECREGMNLARGYAMARQAREGRDMPE